MDLPSAGIGPRGGGILCAAFLLMSRRDRLDGRG